MKDIIKIHIGGYCAFSTPSVITTLLGSCVSACLYDPVCRIGGMNHILIPGRADLKTCSNVTRYGVNAMELLINEMMKKGARKRNIAAKVFGGAKVLNTNSGEGLVGLKNAEFVIDFLGNERIRIMNYNIGGTEARRIFFHTDTGDVFLKRIPTHMKGLVSVEEMRMQNRLKKMISENSDPVFFS